MKQVVRRGLKEIIVDEVPAPSLAPHHVIIRTHHSLISSGTETASIHTGSVLNSLAENPSHLRTVWNAMQSAGPQRTIDEVRAKFEDYAVLGYAGAGVVAAVHPTVTDLQVGDRVSYGGEGTGHGELIMTGRNLVARIPDGVSTRDAAFSTLGAIAMHAVRNAEISLGDTVAVIGLGLVGQLVTQLARAQGARVIAIDLDAARVRLAASLGAHHPIDGGGDVAAAVGALTNGVGADCVIIAAAAKSNGPAMLALNIARERGRVVVVGAVDLSFPYHAMFRKELQVRMSRAYGPGSYDPEYEREGRDYPLSYVRWTENRNMEEFLRRIGSGEVRVEPMVSHQMPLEKAPEAYRMIMDRAVPSLGIVLEYPVETTGSVPSLAGTRVPVDSSAAPSGVIGFGLVGAGNIARWAHLPALRKDPRARLAAVATANGAKGKALAKRYEARYVTTSYEEVLRDAAIAAIIVTSRNQAHADQTLRALNAGKHVFIEKPMAVTADECRAIVETQARTGRAVGVAFNRRFAPAYRTLKQAMHGRTGPAVMAARMNSPYMSSASWMTDPAAGGAVVGEACHMVDLLAWLADATPVRVTATCLPLGEKEPAGESNITSTITFSDGSIASLVYCAVGDPKAGGERVEIFRSGRSAWSEDFKRYGTLAGGSKSKLFPDKGYDAQFTAFLDLVQGKRSEIALARDGAISTLTCLAILQSARNGGQTIRIDSESLTLLA